MSKHQRPSSSVGQHEQRQQKLHPRGERRQTVCTGLGSSPETGLSCCHCHRAWLAAGISAPLPLAPWQRLQQLPPAPSCRPAVPGRVSPGDAVHPTGLASCARGSCLRSWALPWCLLGGCSPPRLLQEGWMRPSDAVRVKVMGWGQQGIEAAPHLAAIPPRPHGASSEPADLGLEHHQLGCCSLGAPLSGPGHIHPKSSS